MAKNSVNSTVTKKTYFKQEQDIIKVLFEGP